MTDKLFHQFRFRKSYVFDRVCGEESVLNIKEWSFCFFCGAAGDQSKITGFLSVAGEQCAPSTVRYTIHVIVTGMLPFC